MTGNEQRRLETLRRLEPLSFSGAKLEDAQGFLDKCKQILLMAGILETNVDSFTIFQFTGDAFRWWEAYERRRPVDDCREELCRQFEQLCQEGMPVTQYEMRFSKLARHIVWLVPTDWERIRRFIDGLTYQLQLLMTREMVFGATFNKVVDIAWYIEMVCSQEHGGREAKRPRGLGGFSGVPSGGGQSSLSSLAAQSSSRAPSVQGLSMPGPSSSYPGAWDSLHSQPPALGSCFECGEFGHMWRQCPRRSGGVVQQRSQVATFAPVTSPPSPPARGGAQSA
ncbi:uncharacterized protein [Nicotiana tomentosiformis]|uniref:uncharacterized protein n=1 Tax=Nicotiana tomentosiformis TaxID=4098 RepID=UPI00388C96F8